MLQHVCDVPMTETCVDQSELVNVGAQIDKLTIWYYNTVRLSVIKKIQNFLINN